MDAKIESIEMLESTTKVVYSKKHVRFAAEPDLNNSKPRLNFKKHLLIILVILLIFIFLVLFTIYMFTKSR